MTNTEIRRFRIDIPQADLDDLRSQKELAGYWAEKFGCAPPRRS
ncbi:hypothetical protein [Nocardia gamkensis]